MSSESSDFWSWLTSGAVATVISSGVAWQVARRGNAQVARRDRNAHLVRLQDSGESALRALDRYREVALPFRPGLPNATDWNLVSQIRSQMDEAIKISDAEVNYLRLTLRNSSFLPLDRLGEAIRKMEAALNETWQEADGEKKQRIFLSASERFKAAKAEVMNRFEGGKN